MPPSLNPYLQSMDHNARGVRPRSVNELVDLRCRPEVNTIGALAESDSSEHPPLAEPIWTTPAEEEYGLGVGRGKPKNESLSCIGGAARIEFPVNVVKSSQVVGLRDRVAIIRALLHAISSPHRRVLLFFLL